MPKKLDEFPGGRRGRVGMDWTPFLDGAVWQFSLSELPHKSLNTAGASFRRKAEGCSMKARVAMNSGNETLTVQAVVPLSVVSEGRRAG